MHHLVRLALCPLACALAPLLFPAHAWLAALLACVVAIPIAVVPTMTALRAAANVSVTPAETERRLRRAERLAAWRDIARQMAHEIKNPLTPIQMAVEVLQKARARNLPEFDALFEEETHIVLEEVARLRRLVETFSRFARAPRPRPEMLALGDVVTHVLTLQRATGEAELTGEVEAGLANVNADREQLTQVLLNLVANASHAAAERAVRDHGKPPAAVHVSVRKLDARRVAIDVDDNGAGIDPSVRERLFEPYATTRAGRGGTGLGLAVAWRIVEEHGGAITVETSAHGTRFEVQLPFSGPTPTMQTTEGVSG